MENANFFGRNWRLARQVFWHLGGQIFLNNMRIHGGGIGSISWLRECQEDADMISLYEVLNLNREKENVWEECRLKVAPNLPSRLGALFLFIDEPSADHAAKHWFANQRRGKFKVRVTTETQIHLADSRWLDGSNDEWERRASQYWAGHPTNSPLFEIVAHGPVFVDNWQDFLAGGHSTRSQA